mmetsp:Transcript_9125/g.33678  ORF Transcript_9125/g.33678 Transcript_9125/m.33678 type:complete len:185 (+) Transcript_9125:114-668(+)
MGSIFSSIWQRLSSLFADQECKILIIGLDAAGKSTLLYKIQLGEVIVTQPTIGAHVEEVNYNGVQFTMFDLGGQESLRKTWSVYFTGAQVIILVVDSTDGESRMKLIREELFSILPHEELKNTKVLVFANKQDKKGALSAAEVSKILNLHKIKDHAWKIQPCCALTGEGLKEGLDWIVSVIEKK